MRWLAVSASGRWMCSSTTPEACIGRAISKSLAIDLADRGIIAIALSPGWVRTEMGGSGTDLDVETSVRGLKRVIDGLSAEDSGKFLPWDGRELPW